MEDVDYGALTGIHIGEMFDLFHSNPTDTGKRDQCDTRQHNSGRLDMTAHNNTCNEYVVNLAIKIDGEKTATKGDPFYIYSTSQFI